MSWLPSEIDASWAALVASAEWAVADGVDPVVRTREKVVGLANSKKMEEQLIDAGWGRQFIDSIHIPAAFGRLFFSILVGHGRAVH